MTKALHIAKELSLPLDAITSRMGFTGQSESGKTYAAMKLAEEMLDVGAQVIALDPVGPWYGLKMGKDQRTSGLPVVVFGGVHQDLPLPADSGAKVAEVLARSRASAVLDVSEFTMGELSKFAAAFAEHFFDAKKTNKGPVCVFWEEAQSFAPQELPPDPHAALMLNRVVRMVKVGRNYGIGNVLITQEPQAVSKRALSQVNCLFIGRMQGDHAKKAIKAWVADKATSKADIDLMGSLSSLPQGEMFVAEPRWFGPIRAVHIAEKRTFDSSRTPKLGEDAPEPGRLAAVDLRELRSAMAEEVKKAEADPAALRLRIAEIEEQLRKKVARAAPAPKVEIRDRPVLKEGQLQRTEKIVEKAAAALSELAKVIRPTIPATAFENREGQPQLTPLQEQIRGKWEQLPDARPARAPVPRPIVTRVPAPAPVNRPAVAPRAPAGDHQATGDLKPAQLRVLEVIASKDGLSKRSVAVRAGYRIAGHLGNLIGALKTGGFIEQRGGGYYATDLGRAQVPNARPLSPAEAREKWRQELGSSEWNVLDTVIQYTPAGGISKPQLAEATGYQIAGHFGNMVGKLKTAGLIENAGGLYVAAQDLMEAK